MILVSLSVNVFSDLDPENSCPASERRSPPLSPCTHTSEQVTHTHCDPHPHHTNTYTHTSEQLSPSGRATGETRLAGRIFWTFPLMTIHSRWALSLSSQLLGRFSQRTTNPTISSLSPGSHRPRQRCGHSSIFKRDHWGSQGCHALPEKPGHHFIIWSYHTIILEHHIWRSYYNWGKPGCSQLEMIMIVTIIVECPGDE